MKSLSRLLFVIAIAAFFLPDLMGALERAEGQRGPKAQVFVVQRSVPRTLPGRDGHVQFGRKHNKRTLQEVTDVPVAERSWLARLIVKFDRPLGDWEFDVVFYDLSQGGRRYMDPPITMRVSDRDGNLFIQPIELKRPEFEPGMKLELTIRTRGQEAGSSKIQLAGERIRIQHTGEVDFTK